MLHDVLDGRPVTYAFFDADMKYVEDERDAVFAKIVFDDGSQSIWAEIANDEEPKTLGGKGSGNWGHAGRPGERGGSAAASEEVAAAAKIIGRSASEYRPANENGSDTRSRYMTSQGRYTAQREELHRAIVTKFLAGKNPKESPTATVLGGGPASGKSSIVNDEGLIGKDTVHIDVDEIRKEIPEYREGLGKSETISSFTHEESSDVARLLLETAAAKRMDLVLDGVGDSTVEKLGAKIAVMRDGGHKVVAQYVTVDADTAVARMIARGKKTGRYVPETHLRETHAKVSQIFPDAIAAGLFDKAYLYDTNGPKPERVIEASGKDIKVLAPNLWKKFLDKAAKNAL